MPPKFLRTVGNQYKASVKTYQSAKAKGCGSKLMGSFCCVCSGLQSGSFLSLTSQNRIRDQGGLETCPRSHGSK